MPVSPLYVFQQGPGIAALVKVARASRRGAVAGAEPAGPKGPLTATVPARDPKLVADYIRHVGGNPSAWAGALPPHLYSQWAFPLLADLLVDLPYDLSKMLNGGCRIEAHRPIPANEPLLLSARRVSVDDDERRVVIHQEVTTGTSSAPDAMTAHLYVIIPKPRKKDGPKPATEPTLVPADARELVTWKLPANAGRDFALLTGDFNPIHWIPLAGKAAGFGGCILHGFGTMARAIEGIHQGLLAGDVHRLASVDVRFVKPLRLPGKAGLYLNRVDNDTGSFSVGTAPGSPAFLTGTFTLRGPTS